MVNIGSWDTENTAMLAQVWSLWPKSIPPQAVVEPSRILCFGWKWEEHDDPRKVGKYTFKAAYEHGRAEMLETVSSLLTEADAVISWNGVRHDTKKINTEFALEGMKPPAPWKEVDLMRAVKSRFAFASNSLDYVAQSLGLGQKTDHETFYTLYPKVLGGDVRARRELAKYQRRDVDLLGAIYRELLPWIPASMHPNVAIGSDFACTRCGSERLERRGLFRTNSGAYQRYRCLDCGAWPHGSQRMDTTALR